METSMYATSGASSQGLNPPGCSTPCKMENFPSTVKIRIA
jgi:hypothetical protein